MIGFLGLMLTGASDLPPQVPAAFSVLGGSCLLLLAAGYVSRRQTRFLASRFYSRDKHHLEVEASAGLDQLKRYVHERCYPQWDDEELIREVYRLASLK